MTEADDEESEEEEGEQPPAAKKNGKKAAAGKRGPRDTGCGSPGNVDTAATARTGAPRVLCAA